MSLEPEVIQKFQLVFGEQLNTLRETFSQILNADVTMEASEFEQFEESGFSNYFVDEVVRATVVAEEGFPDSIVVLLGKELGSTAADLMLMGDGSAEFNAMEHIDALKEIFSQLFGPLAADLTAKLGTKVEFGSPEVELLDVAEVTPALTDRLTIVINTTVAEKESIWTFSFTEKQVNLMANTAELGEETEETETEAEKESRPVSVERAEFEKFPVDAQIVGGNQDNIDMLMDLQLKVSIELGRTRMFIKEILNLAQGSVIELNKLSGDPVDIYINEKKFAEGEVVVIDENFGVRITDVVSPSERVKTLGE